MKCRDAFEEISRFFDGKLDPELRRVLEEHLAKCVKCKVVMDTTRKTIELYCNGKLSPLPEPVRDRLHATLRRKCLSANL